ncbi:MAG: queuosine precursor transporter [Opitutales bacterium]|nr:queuosine precursor transporter [Opitutales bacterium]
MDFVESGCSVEVIKRRRERVLIFLVGIFLGTLAMLNILGITRFIHLFDAGGLTFAVAVGVLPYPITFLCTDLISEFYGRSRAKFVVWLGLVLNCWLLFILWLGGLLPGFEATDPVTGEVMRDAAGRLPVFFELQALTIGAAGASMIAYLTAQFVDVHVFHFWKRLTKGRHLWLRNIGSTTVSQLVDTVAVILVTHFYARALPLDEAQSLWPQLAGFIVAGYAFKAAVALGDTALIYPISAFLKRYLQYDPVTDRDLKAE